MTQKQIFTHTFVRMRLYMFNSNKSYLFILIYSWLIVNLLIYKTLGIKYAIDTVRFDAEASAWINGTFELSYHFWYTGYILILALCKLYFHSIYPSIGIQCGLSLISVLLFYKGLSNLLAHERSAFIAALLVILYIPIQQWNVCLLTESFFINSILLFVWAYTIRNTKTKWICLFVIALLATTLRPNGGILLITVLLLSAKQFITAKNKKYIYSAGMIVTASVLVLLNNTTDVFYRFLIDSFGKGEVICGYSGWTVPVKSPIEVDNSYGSFLNIIQLIITHPMECIQLGIYRLSALWTDFRMYYSFMHNTFIVLFLIAAYLFAGIGIYRYRKIYSGLFLITISYAGLNSLLVMITYADWDGRFLAPLLPVIFIWSGLGITNMYGFFWQRT